MGYGLDLYRCLLLVNFQILSLVSLILYEFPLPKFSPPIPVLLCFRTLCYPLAVPSIHPSILNLQTRYVPKRLSPLTSHNHTLSSLYHALSAHNFPQYTTLSNIQIYTVLTHCGRVTQICVFNTVKLGTSASSP